MKKTFFKGLAAIATLALTMSVSAMIVSAEELNMTTTPGSKSGIFTVGSGVETDSTSKSYTLSTETEARSNTGLKLSSNVGSDGTNAISFTTTGPTKLTVVVLGGGTGDRGLNLYYDDDGTPTMLAETFVATSDNSTMVEGTYEITSAGTYYIGRMSGKTMRVYYVDVTATTGTVYDKSLFEDETVDPTAVIKDTDVYKAKVTADGTYTDENSIITIGTGISTGTVDTDGYEDVTFYKTGGKTSSSNNTRIVTIEASANDVVVLSDFVSNGSDTRYVALSSSITDVSESLNSFVYGGAGATPTDVILAVPSSGTWYLCFTAAANFTGVAVYEGTVVTAPSVSFAETTVDDESLVAFKGTISGSASDETKVTAINVVTARGYDASGEAVSAKTHSITTVAEDGSDYVFIVTMDKTAATELGLKIQASVDYEVNGSTATSYSDIVDYEVQ